MYILIDRDTNTCNFNYFFNYNMFREYGEHIFSKHIIIEKIFLNYNMFREYIIAILFFYL